MKKLILTLAVALSTLCSFAGDVTVSSRVLDAFKTDFASAKEITWTVNNDYYKASFVFNDQHVAAFYNTDGELIGMTRYISSLDLPLSLQTKLKNGYKNYWISDLFEVSNQEGTRLLYHPGKCRFKDHIEINWRRSLEDLPESDKSIIGT